MESLIESHGIIMGNEQKNFRPLWAYLVERHVAGQGQSLAEVQLMFFLLVDEMLQEPGLCEDLLSPFLNAPI